MFSFNANDAEADFDEILNKVQSEPVEIQKNGTAVAVDLSTEEYNRMEALKMELVKSLFENIDEGDLQEGNSFLDELDSGKYD